MVQDVIDTSKEAKLPVRERWLREMEREVLFRIHEPCYHYPAWVTQLTGKTYSLEQMEWAKARTEEWNRIGIELIDVLRRWAETEALEV